MYQSQSLPVREATDACHQKAFDEFLEAGTWFTGSQRMAILDEIRHAGNCQLCKDRKAALSPYSLQANEGRHSSLGVLSDVIVEVIHRILSDSGRLTLRWFQSVMDSELSAAEYIEIVGLIGTAIILDSFANGLGMDCFQPDRSKLSNLAPNKQVNTKVIEAGAWVPLLDVAQEEGRTILPSNPNIFRAMGLVPLAIQQFFAVMRSHYGLSDSSFELSRTQTELLAARMSSYNDCFY